MSGFTKHINTVSSKLRRSWVLLPLALIVIGLICGSALAQQLSADERAQLTAKKEALFQQTLRQPANLDVAFAYADVSAKLGDNEAAISALERMLLFNPNLPRVQLEVGALYFRLGSYEIARSYFERALAANPPTEVQQRIQTYLGEMERLSTPNRLTGFVAFGAQHQSDANLAGASVIAGIPVQPQFTRQADWNFFGTTTALYSYDLGGQSGDAIEVLGLGFANHYGKIGRLDLGLVETTVGPRFNFADPLPWVSQLTLKPYVIANDVSLGGNQYFNTWGVGGEKTALVWGDVRLKAVFEFRQKNFENAPDRPLSRGFNGSDKLVSLFAAKQITTVPDSDLSLEFDFLDQDTRLAYYTNKAYTVSAAYRIRYDDPTGTFRRPMDTTFFIGHTWADYAAPDPCCGVASNRSDRKLRFGITQSFQLTADVAVFVQLQRDIVSSNVPLYDYTNNTVTVGPQIRF